MKITDVKGHDCDLPDWHQIPDEVVTLKWGPCAECGSRWEFLRYGTRAMSSLRWRRVRRSSRQWRRAELRRLRRLIETMEDDDL